MRDLFGTPLSIGVIGARQRDSYADLEAVVRAFFSIYLPGDSIVSGGCKKGGDRFAELLAAQLAIPITVHLPDTTALDPKLQPRAAYAKIAYDRNTLVARDSDVLIACVCLGAEGGTEDTIAKWMWFHSDHSRLMRV